MATSPNPLVWDFYRTIGTVEGSGAVVHYYDEMSQSIYDKNGIATKVAEVDEGQWETAVLGEEKTITATNYNRLAFDHPNNGTLHGVGVEGNNLYYLRYIYAMEISDAVASGSWQENGDNEIKQMAVDIKNIGADAFTSATTLFQPGGRLSLAFTAGDSEPFAIGVAFLDEITYNNYAATVPISGRNTCGYYLNDQTFDLDNTFTGTVDVVLGEIFTLAGVNKYLVQAFDTVVRTYEFNATTTILAGIKEVLEYYPDMKLIETGDGLIVVGNVAFIAPYQINSYYSFNGGSEVFSRQTSKNADACYSYVLVSGKDSEGNALTPIKQAVNHYNYWAIGSHKTKHITAPDGMSQEELASYAVTLANQLQYVGMGEQFTSPLRPWLLVGDVASIYYSGVGNNKLGLVTGITHNFGDNGFSTDFSVDSGGVAVDGTGYVMVQRSGDLTGYNRKQNLVDIINVAINKNKS